MPSSNRDNARLDSWKDIASYLRRDVRTVIRWEKQKGLPVRRVPGGQRQSVFAYTAELDSWLRREETEPHGLKPIPQTEVNGAAEAVPFLNRGDNPNAVRQRLNRRWLYALAIGAGLTISIASLLAAIRARSRVIRSAVPVRVSFAPTSMQAFDERENLLWTHRFEGRIDDQWVDEGRHLIDLTRIGDFRGDGEREVLAAVPMQTDINLPSENRWEVDLFSSQGRLLWSYVPQRRFQFGKYELSGPWVVMDVLVSGRSGRSKIWVAVSQGIWGNSYVVNLDPENGKETLRFVNTGSVYSLAESNTPQGTFLLAGGFNNEPDTGSLAIINEAKAFAASPQSEGSRHKCMSCPAGNPDYYFVFPRSEINELEQVHEAAVVQVRVLDDQIQVRKSELRLKENDPETIYMLKAEPSFHVASLRFGSGYDMVHERLEKEGKLDHTLEHCPERLHPRPVKMWTPAEGWSEIGLEPTAANQ
jgi:hypothetical protein